MRFIDLFSGAGGLSVGFELTGAFTCVGGIDSYAPAIQSFFQNHPAAKKGLAKATDITELDPVEYQRATGGKVDLIVGGPPCQGFSHAGPRERNDPRNRMVWEYFRFIEGIRPKAFVMENVSGLLTTAQKKRGELLEALCEEYWKLGYSTSWKILNSADFRVPQKRKRLVLIGLMDRAKPFEFPLSPCGEEPRMFSYAEPMQTVSDALSDLPSPTEDDPQPYVSEPQTWLQQFLRHGSDAIYNHSITRHSPEMVARLRRQKQGARLYENWNHSWRRLVSDQPSPAVKENHRAPFVHDIEHRVTSPRECARLQTFPDWVALTGTKTQQLIQVGNAVPCLMAAHIATALAEHLNLPISQKWGVESNPWSIQRRTPQLDRAKRHKASA